MTGNMLRGVAIAWVLCQGGCGGASSNQTPTDDPNPPVPATTDNSPSPTTEAAPSPTDAQTRAPDADRAGDCGGKPCEAGQSCIEYYGFAGNKLYTCGIPCKEGAPNDGCPEEMQCQVIPDGPTQCRERKP